MRVNSVQRNFLFLLSLLLCLSAGVAYSVWANGVTAAASAPGVRLVIIMYHSVMNDGARTCDYIVSVSQLENDLKYIRENGYESVSMTELIDYTNGFGDLPEKPILITFDDGCLNFITNALPLLEKYQMHALVSVVGEYTDRYTQSGDHNPKYAYMTWDDIATLARNPDIEIGNHSYNLHAVGSRRGSMKKESETLQQYQNLLFSDLNRMQSALNEKSGVNCQVFTYPFGRISSESFDVIKQLGFLSSLSCYEKNNLITRDPECLYLLSRFNRPSRESSASFFARIEKAAVSKRSSAKK